MLIPPLRGDSGGCAFLFFYSLIIHSGIFLHRLSCCFAAPDEGEKNIPKNQPPSLAKGVRGI
jgi:hypothetical protein